jgi:hypothetical protein
VLSFVASMPLLYGGEVQPSSSYVCPMHPEVTASEQGTCPKCGMRLVPVQTEALAPSSYACPMHPEVTASEPTKCPKCGMKLVPSDAMPASQSHVGHVWGRVGEAMRKMECLLPHSTHRLSLSLGAAKPVHPPALSS